MVDIDCYGIPIRVPDTPQHMSSDSFWGADNTTSNVCSDSMTQPDSDPTESSSPPITYDKNSPADGEACYSNSHGRKIIHQHIPQLQSGKENPRMWLASGDSVTTDTDAVTTDTAVALDTAAVTTDTAAATTDTAAATTDTAVALDWNMSSPVSCHQQQQLSSSLMTSTVLECSASDLELCLGLQQEQQRPNLSTYPPPPPLLSYLQYKSFPLRHSGQQQRCDLTDSHEAELAQLNLNNSSKQHLDREFFAGLREHVAHFDGVTYPATTTSLLNGLESREGRQILSMPSQNITQSAYVGGTMKDERKERIYAPNSQDWAEREQHFSPTSDTANGDIDLSDISLRFSPFKSMTAEGFPAFLSSSDGDSSFSTSADNLKTLADGGGGGGGPTNARGANQNNYFLTFQDVQQSGISASIGPYNAASMQRSDIARSAGSIFASREGKMDDSGAISEAGGAGARDSRHTSTNSNKMKCWTDVIDDEDADGVGGGGDDVFKEQSFIASLSKDRKHRSSSSQKVLSTGNSNGSSENLTSGYSTSSMNGSGQGNGAFAYRPQLLRPTQRVRQSPSLPLNLQNGGERSPPHSSNIQTNTSTTRSPSSIPRSRCSAPDLKFLTQPQTSHPSQNRVPVQHPLSCPANESQQSKLPFRVNTVEDWDSLRVLLPAAFQRAFSGNKSKEAPHPTRSVSLPERMGTAVPVLVDDNVCPTCFKMQSNPADMTASVCDCTPTSSSAASVQNEPERTPPSSRRTSQGSVFVPPGIEFRRDRQYQPVASPNLMEFSRHLNEVAAPSQLIINLKQKQELVTLVKAAAMGLVGFRQIQKDHSDNLSHVIEQQLTSALHALMEDGLRAGCSVWSTVVKQCSPTLYRRHLATMIEANDKLTSDPERFHAFIQELLRLSDLNAWLLQIVQGNTPAALRQYYSMDGFLFLANSVTKDLWDDLMDTLSWLSSTSQSHCESFMQQPDIHGPKHSPRFQISPSRQAADQSASSNSIRRLTSKLGRRISLLPACSPNGMTAAGNKKVVTAGNTGRPTLPSPAAPPVPPIRKMFTPGQVPAQPHLPMSSRWSEWTLSERDNSDGSSQIPHHRLDVPSVVTRSRKSPSMYDMRSVIM
ncbi:hypothetical protein BV898_01531 [Hypsibius exemplaris]|uniref:RUN domain-containing protein n=1 Tax=Hypsibius exemplaris TaxID=2072580 RepID=A0A1W0XAB5_HYPEX|nr:hypothetical protein BV898_01531 [Hypsibius exemplaris]